MDRYSTTGLMLGPGGLSFPLTKTVLWDHEPHGQPIYLHLTANHNPQVCIDMLVLQLAHKYAEDSGNYLCTLIGSLIPDGSGVQVHVDRFEPDWNDSGVGSSHNNSVSLIPGDIAIPCVISKSDENQTPVADYIATLRTLQKRLPQSDRCGLQSYLSLKATCCVTRSQEVRVEFDLVTVTTRLLATLVASVPLLGTPLCRNLMSPLNMGELQGESKMGYMTMDHTRKLIVMMDNDPKVQNLPLVGIWVTGVEDVTDPYVWSACLKYLHCCSLKDRICLPPEPFLVVVFSSIHQHPQYYEISVSAHDLVTQHQLNSGMEFVQLSKNHPDSSRRGVELDLIRIENGPKFEAFSSATEQLTVIPEREVPRKVEDLVPRTSPAPHQSVKSITSSPLHEVPEVSLLGEENFEKSTEHRVLMSYFKKKDKENTKPKDLNNNQNSKSVKQKAKVDCQLPQSQANQAGGHRGQRPRSPVPSSCYQPRYQSPPHYYPYTDAYGAPIYQQSYPYQGQYYGKPYRVPQSYYTSPPQPMYRQPRRQAVPPYGQVQFRPGYGRGVQNIIIPSQNQQPSYGAPLSPNAPVPNQPGFIHTSLPYSPNSAGLPVQQSMVPEKPAPVSLPPVTQGNQASPFVPNTHPLTPTTTPTPVPTTTPTPSLQTYSIDQNGTPTTITTTPDVYQLIKNQDAQLKLLQQQLQLLLEAQKKGDQEKPVERQVEILAEKVQEATRAVNTSLMIAAPHKPSLHQSSTLQTLQTLLPVQTELSLPDTDRSTSSRQTDDNTDSLMTSSHTSSSRVDSDSMFSSQTTSTVVSSSEKSSSNSDTIHFSLHMTALQNQSSETTSVVSDIVVDLPGYEYSNESPLLGEESPVIQSVSMYDPHNPKPEMPQSHDQEQVHEQVVFYEKLIDNIQHLLEGGPDPEVDVSGEPSASVESQPARDLALEALEQLRQLTIDVKSEEDQENVNRSLCEMEAAVLEKINYVSMMFEDSGDTDLSMEVNALAMKYLGEETHFPKRISKPLPLLQSSVFAGGSTNMSFASRKYMERHGLLDSFAASKLLPVPEVRDVSSNDITILRDIQPLKIPVINWQDEIPEKDCSRRREDSAPKYEPTQRYEPTQKYEPGAYSGSHSMFSEKSAMMPQSITESQHQRRISSWCRQVEPPQTNCIDEERDSYISVSDCSEISHWEKRTICEGAEDTTFCSGMMNNCDVRPYESTPAAGKRTSGRRTPVDSVRRTSLENVRRATVDSGRRTPVDRRNSSGEQRNSSGEQRNSSGDSRNSSGEQRNSSGDRRNSSGEQRNSSGEQRNSSGEQRNSSGEQRNSSGDRRNSSGDRRNSSGDRRSSLGDRPGSSDGRRTPFENRTLVENTDTGTNLSSSSQSSSGSHCSQDPPVKDDNYRFFDRPAREMEPLPPVSQSFIERERDARAQIQDMSAQANILDIGRLKQLPKLL